jgi:murein DD-endopeptidase MepM/ murein hydrolase activator NlpD
MILSVKNPLLVALCSASLIGLVSACAGRTPVRSTPASTKSDSPPAASPASRTVQVIARREGEATRFYVENNELCEVTMTFEMRLVNLKSSRSLPYTATFPGQQTTEAFCVEPSEPGAKWEYSYTNSYKLGSNCACHQDAYVYHLPYRPGARYLVTQGYNGSFSHRGANQYAIDWKMPEGTLVCAAREGLVVKVRQDSNRGGGSVKFDKYNNFVLIRHDDGTLAHYCHLQQDGVLVKPGDRVQVGEPIAHSGNTGFSSGPHLHFCVFKAKSGRERESIPVRFLTATDSATTLVESARYQATDAVGSAGATSHAGATTRFGD